MEIRLIFLIKRGLLLSLLFMTVNSFSQNLNILDFGAKADGATINTVPIQAAIDKCSLNSGGQVIVPAGMFLSGTLILKASVELHLMEGAVPPSTPRLQRGVSCFAFAMHLISV